MGKDTNNRNGSGSNRKSPSSNGRGEDGADSFGACGTCASRNGLEDARFNRVRNMQEMLSLDLGVHISREKMNGSLFFWISSLVVTLYLLSLSFLFIPQLEFLFPFILCFPSTRRYHDSITISHQYNPLLQN